MTPHPATVAPDDSLQTARAHMAEHHCRRLPVLESSGQLCGIITDRDLRLVSNSPLILRERWQDDMRLEHTSVDACMTPKPLTITSEAPLQTAVALLLAHKISGLPVLDGDELVDIVTITDLLQALQRLLG